MLMGGKHLGSPEAQFAAPRHGWLASGGPQGGCWCYVCGLNTMCIENVQYQTTTTLKKIVLYVFLNIMEFSIVKVKVKQCVDDSLCLGNLPF